MAVSPRYSTDAFGSEGRGASGYGGGLRGAMEARFNKPRTRQIGQWHEPTEAERVAEMRADAAKEQARIAASSQIPVTGPTWPRVQSAIQQYQGQLQGLAQVPGMQNYWQTQQPQVSQAFSQLRQAPEMQAVSSAFQRELSPQFTEAQRRRLLTDMQASLGSDRDMRLAQLQEAAPNMSPAERRRYARQIRTEYAQMKAALPLQVDQHAAARLSSALGQGAGYALGLYQPQAAAVGQMIPESGRFQMTPYQQAELQRYALEAARTPTRAGGGPAPAGGVRWTPMGANLTGGGRSTLSPYARIR